MHLAEHMVLQDQRLMWDIKRHPTVLAFALEGDTSPTGLVHCGQTPSSTIHRGYQYLKRLPIGLFQVEYNRNPTSISVDLRTVHQVGSSRPLHNQSFWIGHRSPNPMQRHIPTMQHWEVSYLLHDRLGERTAQTIQKNSKPGARLGKRPLIRLNRPLSRVICVRLQTSRSTPAPMDG